MKERRRFIRIYMDIPMTYKHLDAEEEVRISTMVNVSHMGLCFLCEENLATGDMLEFTFNLPPGPRTVSVSGKVIWANNLRGKNKSIYEVGVEFVDTDDEDQLTIQQFIQYERMAERNHMIKKHFVKVWDVSQPGSSPPAGRGDIVREKPIQ
ncbi:PilZ domain-containing protein [candidate division NPL-UPA2 bacterium Unc8]|uniref:PilZ domain-containing protein n=1 Tax=candidate division NPL-UPA2 bacterium Unc8 TaxID=1980939 RepID=A0A399FUY7_UNCN2|nr:MAG: PilZ domain-containing protein [candidate division NPL-UPA2 bacterium Unc8]